MTLHASLARALVGTTLLGMAVVALPTLGHAGPSADRWAVVDPAATCTVARGKGVVSSASLGTGLCQIIFNKNVSACEYNLTPGSAGISGGPVGEGGVAPRAGNVNGVFTATFDSAGAPAAVAFHVYVACN